MVGAGWTKEREDKYEVGFETKIDRCFLLFFCQIDVDHVTILDVTIRRTMSFYF